VSKPRIGLTLAAPNELNVASHGRYRDALEAAGAEVIALYPTDRIPTNLDGLVLSGGGDIAPERYGAEDEACEGVSPERDQLEIAATRVAMERDVPILGICRGFQVLNVVRGGQLIQDVPDHNPEERTGLIPHEIQPPEGSLLAAATGGEPLSVNSRHHQAVTRETLGHGLTVTVEVDGLVEAFEADDQRWVVGVQWHPERTWEVSPAAVGIFDAFVAAAAASATR
jgi:putative glutamine amidotransferase